jgi:hypothetical protein
VEVVIEALPTTQSAAVNKHVIADALTDADYSSDVYIATGISQPS